MFNDADLDAAVEGAIASKYRNAGQTCVCANRLYVQSGVYDEFAKKLAVAVGNLNVGNGVDAGVTTGPMIEEKAVQKVEGHIADATSKGASVILGGKRHTLGHSFFEPTILTNVTQQMLVAREKPLVRSHRCSNLKPKKKFNTPMTPDSAWLRIFTA